MTAVIPDRRDRQWWTALIVVTALGLAFRVAYVLLERSGVPLRGDPIYYHHGANLLVDGFGFINAVEWVEDGRVVQAANHPPLYLLYLSAFSAVGLRSVEAHLVASALLGAVSVLLAGLAGRAVGGRRVGLVGAILVAFYPNVWRFDGMVLSETMVIATVMLTIWLAYRCWRNPSTWSLAAVAAAAGLATLSRSELGLLAPLLVAPLAVGTARRLEARWWKLLGVGAVTFTLVLAPWVGFNLSRFERPVLLSGQLEVTLAVANCERTYHGMQLGYWDYRCGQDILDRNGLDMAFTEAAAQEALLRDTVAFVRENLDRVPVVMAARVGRILGVYKPIEQIRIDTHFELFPGWVMWSASAAYWTLVPFAVGGGVVLRKRRVPLYPLLATPVIVVVTVALFYASTRFRASAEGPLCLLAAVGMVAAFDRLRRRVRSQGGESERDTSLGASQVMTS